MRPGPWVSVSEQVLVDVKTTNTSSINGTNEMRQDFIGNSKCSNSAFVSSNKVAIL